MSKVGKILESFLGSDNDDIQKLEAGIQTLRDLHEYLTSKYSLRSDLIELTDQRRSVAKEFSLEKEKVRQFIENSKTICDELQIRLDNFKEFERQFETIQKLLEQEDANGTLYETKLKNLLNKDTLEQLSYCVEKIEEKYKYLFSVDNIDGFSLFDDLEAKIHELENAYKDFFVDKVQAGDELNTKFDNMCYQSERLNLFYDEIFLDSERESTSTKIRKYYDELEMFYNKIFGENNQKSLKLELEERLASLKDIEEEARRVIELSSDAGLAGGFVDRGRQACQNKYVSLLIFVLILMTLGCFNFYTIDFSKIDQITLQSMVNRVLINLPFLWIATVANINLNKYARLEEEYAHKESLAKSYERYKNEVEKLEDSHESDNLKAKLISINLEAFEKNPAKTMQKARSSMPLLGERNTEKAKKEKKTNEKSQETSED